MEPQNFKNPKTALLCQCTIECGRCLEIILKLFKVVYRNWVKLLDTLLATTATLRPYHTGFYRRLTVMVGLTACSVTVAQSVRAPLPGSPGETSPAHGPGWPLPSGWLSDQMCVGGCKLPSRKFLQSSGVDVVVHDSSMLHWSHPRTGWMRTYMYMCTWFDLKED